MLLTANDHDSCKSRLQAPARTATGDQLG